MRTADFDYDLPPDLIAQEPAPCRDQSRLLVVRRNSGTLEHRRFRDLPEYLRSGDVLVLNDSRVIAARLRGVNRRTGGRFELLLLEEVERNEWWAMMRPGRRARAGTEIAICDPEGRPTPVTARVLDTNAEGHRRLKFEGTFNVLEELDKVGEVPLPPYISRTDPSRLELDRVRYQTVFASAAGSVAAPTAGLHFSGELLRRIRERGVEVCFVTLHVGLATFAPVKTETLEGHTLHEERYRLEGATAELIDTRKRAGGRVVAVGTTPVRVLETVAAAHGGRLRAASGRTRLFIPPPFAFQVVDALVTNFHLPRSTLLMLVSAFAAPAETRGRELVLAAYAEAVRQRYRFYSYGDAMLLM